MAYQQVKLQGTGVHSGFQTVAWIPKKFAKLDTLITLLNDSVVWKVTWVSRNVIGDAIYPELLIREHRKNTGDALPRREP
jgi:hypothetical protein